MSLKRVVSVSQFQESPLNEDIVDEEENDSAPIYFIRSETNINEESQHLIEKRIIEEFKKKKLSKTKPFQLSDIK
jgi:hypothetical protein